MPRKAKGKLSLVGFDLEFGEKLQVNELVNTYIKKINQRFGFQEIKLRLKKSERGKAFLHEVRGTLIRDNKEFTAENVDYNLFAAISGVFEKLMSEAEHKLRTKKQTGSERR